MTISTAHLGLISMARTMSDLTRIFVSSGNTKVASFQALEESVSRHYGGRCDEFYTSLLPFIASEASRLIPIEMLSVIIPGTRRVFTKRQCLTILSAAFLFCFPSRTSWNCQSKECEWMPSINLDELFATKGPNPEPRMAKTQMLLYYFQESQRRVAISDVCLSKPLVIEVNRFTPSALEDVLGRPLLTVVVMPLSQSIDDARNMVKVDFANAYIGGGAIAYGCVQEEIMFSICPELIVSRLVVACMDDDVAVAFVGAEQFTKPKGYAFGLQYGGPCEGREEAPTSHIVAIDALQIIRPDSQYHPDAIQREVIKCASGMSCESVAGVKDVATGNWGCGAFGGDPEIKSLIQWVALSALKKEMHYFPFDNQRVHEVLPDVVALLLSKNVSCGALLHALKEYKRKRNEMETPFQYIMRSF